MAYFTTYFVATDEELARAFPGWKRVPAPRKQQAASGADETEAEERPAGPPLSGFWGRVARKLQIQRLPPAPPTDDATVAAEELARYRQLLEERLPSAVRALAHRAWKGLTDVQLAPVAQLLLGSITEPTIERALVPTDGLEATGASSIDHVCERFVASLRAASAEKRRELAQQWSQSPAMRGVAEDELVSVLDELAALHAEGGSKRRMYVLTEASVTAARTGS